MPYVRLEITPAATTAQKSEIVQRFTQTLIDVLHKDPEQIHIVIEEVTPENWGVGGKLVLERRARGAS